MATVTVIFNEKKVTKSGEVPIWLRIIKDRKPKYIALGIKIHSKYWDSKKNKVRKSHQNSKYLNNFIAQKVAEAEAVSLELEAASKYTTPIEIKSAVMGTSLASYYKFAQASIDKNLRMGKIKMSNNEKYALKKLKNFVPENDLLFFDITYQFLKKYEESLKKIKNKTNTIFSDLKIIRKHFNEAEKEGLIPRVKNPFLTFRIKTASIEKSYLTEAEIKTLADKKLDPTKRIYHSRNLYIFACYTGGIRFSDLIKLKWSNYDGEHLTLITGKTTKKLIIKVPNKAIDILNLYKTSDSNPTDYIFPLLKNDVDYSDPEVLFKAIQINNAIVNDNLKTLAVSCKFKKHIHFHTSRHTFATVALKKGMRLEYVSKLMTHSTIKTTEIYAKIVNEELDKAMDIFND